MMLRDSPGTVVEVEIRIIVEITRLWVLPELLEDMTPSSRHVSTATSIPCLENLAVVSKFPELIRSR